MSRHNFNHYDAADFRARQIVAAHQLHDCEHVLEIGGHLHPLTELLQKSVTVVDEFTVPYFQRQGNYVKRHLKITWQEWQRSAKEGDVDCVAFLGVPEVDADLKDFLLSPQAGGFKRVLLEYAVYNLPAANSIFELLSHNAYEQLMSLGMTMATETAHGPRGAHRHMFLLRPKTKAELQEIGAYGQSWQGVVPGSQKLQQNSFN